MRIGRLARTPVELVGPELPLRQAALAMTASGVGSLIVADGDAIGGIFTERDLARALAAGADPDVDTVGRWMSRKPDVFSPSVDAREAAAWLLETGYRHLPVVEGDAVVGVVSIRDVLAAVLQEPVPSSP